MKNISTPGPWLIEWNAAQGGDGHYITDSKDMGELSRIAMVLFHDDADGETRANARLIAAAPDLLDALRRLSLAALARDNVMGDPAALLAAKGELSAAARQADAAIAKATGSAA